VIRRRHRAIEREDCVATLARQDSPEYQHEAAIRDRAGDLVVAEGRDGPQPA
jgi:hypothetical protein